MRHRVCALLIGIAAFTVIAPAAPKPENPGFKIVKRFPIEGGGRWDYLIVDAASRRVYLSRSMHVSVFDADSGATVGDIPDTPGVHGITLAPDLGIGFISDGGENRATVFDLKTLKVLAKVETGSGPDAILYHPASHQVFVMNGKSSSATVIAAGERTVTATIALGGKPEFAAYDDDGNIFVNLEDKSSIAVIDAASNKLKTTWPMSPCKSPSGLAIDLQGHNLFSVCDNKLLTVTNSKSGKVLQTLPIGDECDAVAFDPETGYVFSSSNDGKLTIAHKSASGKFEVVQNLQSEPGSKTMALDTATHRIYLPAAKFAGNPMSHPRPPVVAGSAEMLVIGK
jgi:YVTN family beta-propeller protein